MKPEIKQCQNCKKDFIIEPDDFGFYEKICVPPPTFCPECRRQRRWAWRNNMSLYSRKCELCGKSVVSIYSPNSRLTIYCNKCWWSDKWDPKNYAVDYDFSKPFFTQFNKLMKKVPHMSVVNDDGIASLNCEYTHDWWFSKNCYMCFSGWHVESVMYSFFILAGRDILDSMIIRSKSEKLYECYMTSNCYNVRYSNIAKACIDSQFIYDCIDCQDCFMSYGLRNKRYFFKNKQYPEEEYEKILQSYQLDTFSGVKKAKKEYKEFILNHPRRYALVFRCLNSLGDIVSDSKNVKYSFVAKNSENCRYSDFIGDTLSPDKDSFDLTLCGGVSESYECMVGDHSQLNFFALFSVKSQDLKYTQHCHNCKHSLGSVGIRNSNYVIFNKQYTKEEYEKLAPKIIKHMDEMPYTDKAGNVYKYGEFYPIELSPFGYNESCAPELLALSKEQALERGYSWQDNVQKTVGKETLLPKNIPDSINDIDDSILEEVLVCVECNRNYKIVQNEFIFYKKMKIPIPRKCFFCRHANRLARRNPFKLWHRQCMCEKRKHFHGTGKCAVEFETSYAPDRPEIVYCEKCYQQEVY
ncbi:hypothetical protein A3D42_01240 [Candidatus Nomurabacteria bacterium RIFCSPHIGHO2_02_FULL_41_18]|uniref:Uncharacterized protein n=1 Tax=Candidatus Nomurabacteria bacterium RIFCSPHIGHO2_02_FULL_41_18 TaxID=1801754 RepID=A0A1F6W6Y2_9BACT|nr:MAG: hypothetical protein A3D42_01240 [Candidatus Nomurabacteria bacterium RIFCSPHIGHO2_02_FULL_41_18]OGJ00397.1 MAG: hypothetical protein A3I90_00685 [Candidatus Nomurabacteria bacterium RIFCSPLOWO2_02_FULL_41_9]